MSSVEFSASKNCNYWDNLCEDMTQRAKAMADAPYLRLVMVASE